MTYQQLLALKSMEECSELAQRFSKLIQFGEDEIENGQSLTNIERLQLELTDLMCVIQMFNDELPLNKELRTIPTVEELKVKENKINKYLKYSQELGEL